MPRPVIVESDGERRRNLSDEAYAAFTDRPVPVNVPGYALLRNLFGNRNGRVLAPGDGDERLSEEQVTAMLGDRTQWRLAIPDGDATWVLTREELEAASSGREPGMALLRQPTANELAVLEHAREDLSPRASAERYKAALGVPVANVSLAVAAAAAFVGLRADSEVTRPWALTLAGILLWCSVTASLAGVMVFSRAEVHLSRLDRLQRRRQPPTWAPAALFVTFALALALAVCSIVPIGGSRGDPSPSFADAVFVRGDGDAQVVSYEVGWENLPSDAATVRIVSEPVTGGDREVTVPVSDEEASHEVRVTVTRPGTLRVQTEALDDAGRRVGYLAAYEYDVR